MTVASEMFDNSPDTPEITGVASRHYTGVFRAHDTDQPLEVFVTQTKRKNLSSGWPLRSMK